MKRFILSLCVFSFVVFTQSDATAQNYQRNAGPEPEKVSNVSDLPFLSIVENSDDVQSHRSEEANAESKERAVVKREMKNLKSTNQSRTDYHAASKSAHAQSNGFKSFDIKQKALISDKSQTSDLAAQALALNQTFQSNNQKFGAKLINMKDGSQMIQIIEGKPAATYIEVITKDNK